MADVGFTGVVSPADDRNAIARGSEFSTLVTNPLGALAETGASILSGVASLGSDAAVDAYAREQNVIRSGLSTQSPGSPIFKAMLAKSATKRKEAIAARPDLADKFRAVDLNVIGVDPVAEQLVPFREAEAAANKAAIEQNIAVDAQFKSDLSKNPQATREEAARKVQDRENERLTLTDLAIKAEIHTREVSLNPTIGALENQNASLTAIGAIIMPNASQKEQLKVGTQYKQRLMLSESASSQAASAKNLLENKKTETQLTKDQRQVAAMEGAKSTITETYAKLDAPLRELRQAINLLSEDASVENVGRLRSITSELESTRKTVLADFNKKLTPFSEAPDFNNQKKGTEDYINNVFDSMKELAAKPQTQIEAQYDVLQKRFNLDLQDSAPFLSKLHKLYGAKSVDLLLGTDEGSLLLGQMAKRAEKDIASFLITDTEKEDIITKITKAGGDPEALTSSLTSEELVATVNYASALMKSSPAIKMEEADKITFASNVALVTHTAQNTSDNTNRGTALGLYAQDNFKKNLEQLNPAQANIIGDGARSVATNFLARESTLVRNSVNKETIPYYIAMDTATGNYTVATRPGAVTGAIPQSEEILSLDTTALAATKDAMSKRVTQLNNALSTVVAVKDWDQGMPKGMTDKDLRILTSQSFTGTSIPLVAGQVYTPPAVDGKPVKVEVVSADNKAVVIENLDLAITNSLKSLRGDLRITTKVTEIKSIEDKQGEE